MRRDRIREYVLHSFRRPKTLQSLPHNPSPLYSAMIDSSDRLLVIHPDPATRSPTPTSSRESLRSTETSSHQLEATKTSIQTRTKTQSFSAPISQQRSTASPFASHRCTHCARRLHVYEFPTHLPTRRCRHRNATCVYCLHNSVYTAFFRGGWQDARCLVCGEEMSKEEASKITLLWEEERVLIGPTI
jgi:hypothetical protein